MDSQTVYDMMVDSGVIGGMRGQFPPEVALEVSETLMQAEINAFEFTMNSPRAIEAMQAVKRRFGDEACSGMGTVLDVETAKRVIDAGADFIVSPAFQPDVVQTALDAGVFIAPGVMTPTEAVNAWGMGVKMLKIFPIGPLGLEYFKAITGPLDQMKFMCNGGMSDQNVGEFLRAGAVCCGLVGWLTGDGTWPHDKILARAKTLRRIVNEVRTGQKQAVEI